MSINASMIFIVLLTNTNNPQSLQDFDIYFVSGCLQYNFYGTWVFLCYFYLQIEQVVKQLENNQQFLFTVRLLCLTFTLVL